MVRVLGFGLSVVDEIHVVDKFPKEDTKMRVQSYERQCGGNCANTMVAVSRLGMPARFSTLVGNDDFGEYIINSLEKEGVEVMPVRYGSTSQHSIIVVNTSNHTRTILGHTKFTSEQEVDFDKSVLDGVSLVYIDGRYVSGAKKLAAMAHEQGISVVLEAERLGYGVQDLFSSADVIVSSSQFHNEYFKGKNYEQNLGTLLEQGAKIAIVTLGSEGSMAKKLDDVIRVPAAPCNIVDSTGAGDSYIGGFLYAHANGYSLQKSMVFASAVAAKTCEHVGAQKGLPILSQVDYALQQRFFQSA